MSETIVRMLCPNCSRRIELPAGSTQAYCPDCGASLRGGSASGATRNGVEITGVSIPFWDLVTLMVKLAFAAIPAAIAIGLIWLLVFFVFGTLFGGLSR